MSKIKTLCDKYGIEISTRWENGVEHHDEANHLLCDCYELDFHEYDDSFGWSVGGDGDNGELLIEQMSIIMELRDVYLKDKYPHAFQKCVENSTIDGTMLEAALKVIENNT